MNRHLVFIGESRPIDPKAGDTVSIPAFDHQAVETVRLDVTIDHVEDFPNSITYKGTTTYHDRPHKAHINLYTRDPSLDHIRLFPL